MDNYNEDPFYMGKPKIFQSDTHFILLNWRKEINVVYDCNVTWPVGLHYIALLMILEPIIGTNLTGGSTHQMLPTWSKQCN